MIRQMKVEAMLAGLRMIDRRAAAANEKAAAEGRVSEKMQRLNSLMRDREFCVQLTGVEDAREAVKLFAEHGVKMTVMEVNAFGTGIVAVSRKVLSGYGELSQEELAGVAGGTADAYGAMLLEGTSFGEDMADGVPEVGIMVGCVLGIDANRCDERVSGENMPGRWIRGLL